MSRPGIEYESVERAACHLLSQGQHPSVQKIRDILKTGSNTTIAKHLKNWQANFATKRSPALPEDVPEDLMNPLDDIWALAREKAEESYQQHKEEFEAKLEAAVTAQAETFIEIEAKDGQIKTLQSKLSTLQETLRDTQLQLSQLQGEHTTQTSELEKAYSEIERTHDLLKEQNEFFDNERKRIAIDHENNLKYEQERSASTENRLLSEIDQLRQEVKSQENKYQQHQSELKEYKADCHEREIALHKTNTDLIGEIKRLEAACSELKSTAKSESIAKHQLAETQKQLSKSLDTVAALSKANEQSKNNEVLLAKEIGQLGEALAHLQLTVRGQDDEHDDNDTHR